MSKAKADLDEQSATDYRVFFSGGDHVDITADEVQQIGAVLVFRSNCVDVGHFYQEALAGWIKLSEGKFS